MITTDIIVVGTGFSGMGAAMKLRDSGREDFIVLEKAHDVGGTWRDNTYPGCECDIPSHMYSFSYELKSDWSKSFSGQEEIWAYMRNVADEQGIRKYIRFGVEVTGATWHQDRARWVVHTKDGDDYECRVLIAGVGGLHIPNIPEIAGAESFAGPRFHSAGWDHEVDLKDKKVVVIGTGASAIQFIPIIAQETGHLTVFQRTPPWVLPKNDHPTPTWRKRLFARVPGLQRMYRNTLYWALESRAIAFNGRPAAAEHHHAVAGGVEDHRLHGAGGRSGRGKALHPAAAVPEPGLGAVVLERGGLIEGTQTAEENADVVRSVPHHARLGPRRGIAGKGGGADEDCSDKQYRAFRGENAHP